MTALLVYFPLAVPAAGVRTTKDRIQSLSITGNTAEFSVQDNVSRVRPRVSRLTTVELGTSDTISISLSTGYFASGNLTSGDIRIQ